MARNYGMEEPLFIINVTFLVLAWFTCLLRAWAKLVVLRKVTPDDYLMLCGIIFYTGYAVSAIYGVTHGVGTLGSGMSLEEAMVGLRAWWLCEILYPPVTLSVRTSVAVFLLQIAVQRVHRRIIIGVMVAFWVVTAPLFFVALFQCQPVSYFWMQPFPDVPRGKCMDGSVMYIVSVIHSVISACCDWTLGIIPVFMLWKVQLSVRTKITLSILLSMGVFAGIALIVRVAYVRPFEVSVNFLFETINVANWSILEPSICIIAGCLATLRPIFSCCGWNRDTRHSRKTPVRYRQTRSRSQTPVNRSKNSRIISNPIDPVLISSHNVFSTTSWRARGLLRTPKPEKDEACTEYELMVNNEKDKQLATDRVCDIEEQVNRRTSHIALGDEVHDEVDLGTPAANQNRVRQSMASNASVNSGHSVLFSSLSSLATPFRSHQQLNRLSQWFDSPAPQPLASSPVAASPLSAPALAVPSSPPPPPPIMSPSPCHIFVKQHTMVEYKDSPQSVGTTASLPASAMVPRMPELPRGPTMSSIATDHSFDDNVFGEHSVQISGPSPKL
ncbi:hypothetical protein Sste5346_000697 [Sporothrix stenoceras]|uniref:Rhodopsin domain-containing protein n=1 Tax=Sporothrix stenoceras TaxID=5173 RepID=A0ABR3ZRH6_9PEZI